MKAVVYEQLESVKKLVYRDVDIPTPGADEVLVRVRAVSLNAADYRSMRLGIRSKAGIFGADIAGQVETIGASVTRFNPGDEVFGDILSAGFGGLAEYVAVPERLLACKSPRVSFEEAAALPMASLTALQGLRDAGNLQPGQHVLVYGSAGGVGNFAVQLAKYFGAQVTTVCGPANLDLMPTLGADRILNYQTDDALQNKDQYDLILAVNGKRSLLSYKKALRSKGIFVLIGGQMTQIINTLLFRSFLSLGNIKFKFLAARPNVADLDLIMRLVKEKKIKPVIDRRYPLSQTAEAFEYFAKGHARGKVIITVE